MQLHYPLNPVTGVEDPTQLPWTNGVPSTGQEGSYPPFALMTGPQTELINLLGLAGLTPSDNDMNQLTRAVRGGQLDFSADFGTADALIAQVGLAHTAIEAGLPFSILKGNAPNATTTPTLTIETTAALNGLTGTIVKNNGSPVAAGDLPANALLVLRAISPSKFALISLLALSDVAAQAAASGITSFSKGVSTFTTAGAQTFTASYTGLHRITAWGGGAGGGGSSASSGAGGGGGGGGSSYSYVFLVAGTTYNLVVGAGGAGGYSNGSVGATAGQTTSFNGVALASGGSPGSFAGAGGAGVGGAGGNGVATGVCRNFTGYSGSQGFNVGRIGGGPGGNGNNGGGSGGLESLGLGNSGFPFGGGGSGGVNANGGNGASGALGLEW